MSVSPQKEPDLLSEFSLEKQLQASCFELRQRESPGRGASRKSEIRWDLGLAGVVIVTPNFHRFGISFISISFWSLK